MRSPILADASHEPVSCALFRAIATNRKLRSLSITVAYNAASSVDLGLALAEMLTANTVLEHLRIRISNRDYVHSRLCTVRKEQRCANGAVYVVATAAEGLLDILSMLVGNSGLRNIAADITARNDSDGLDVLALVINSAWKFRNLHCLEFVCNVNLLGVAFDVEVDLTSMETRCTATGEKCVPQSRRTLRPLGWAAWDASRNGFRSLRTCNDGRRLILTKL